MFTRSLNWVLSAVFAICGVAGAAASAWGQFGPVLSGAGPVNRSMAGASVAAPLDATGSLYWNPATSAYLNDTIEFGAELLYPDTTLSSSLPADAFGPGIPPVPLSGTDRGDNGAFVLPSVGLLYTPDNSWLTFGVGVFPVAGYGVNYAASTDNPILTAQPPNGLGVGALFSELQILQVAPCIAARISDRLSVGIGPTINIALVRMNPLFMASPDDANGDGFFTYPDGGAQTRTVWGGGLQVGVYYVADDYWSFGASVKSPQWFETLHFSTVDELGAPRNDTYHAELPLIASIGVSYTGLENVLLAADVRYLDFNNADAFRQQGFDATGAVRGLGFESIFAVALGAQAQLTEATSVRLGYSFNENPISNAQSSFNVASPTLLMHTLYMGASYNISQALTMSFGYAHGFENSVEGPIILPLGAVPGSSVGSSLSVDTFMMGASMRL